MPVNSVLVRNWFCVRSDDEEIHMEIDVHLCTISSLFMLTFSFFFFFVKFSHAIVNGQAAIVILRPIIKVIYKLNAVTADFNHN